MSDGPVKTSLTHPLPLPVVATPGGGGVGMTMCPGKRQPEAVTGPWDRDLATDMAAIVGFGASALVTLMETWELESAKTPPANLKAAALSASLTWHHWPIVDLAAPDAAFEKAWQAEAGELCTRLRNGTRIVVHCRGGRGRSGLVAARFLIERGVGNDDAFAAVRTTQQLAIETPIQEEHVRTFRPVFGLVPGV